MANEYASSHMELAGDYDGIHFIGSLTTDFRYLDDTLIIETPDVEESRFSSVAYAGRTLKDISYKTRKISFDIEIYGASDNAVLSNVERLRALLSRTTSPLYLAGGAYNLTHNYSSSGFPLHDTGDSGLIFGFRLGKDAGPAITTENDASNSYTNNVLYTRVLKAYMTSSERYFTSARQKSVNGVMKYYRAYTLELECEPYLYMRPRKIVEIAEPGLKSGDVSPINSNVNRIIISGANVVGSEPAPTRIMTHLSGAQGIVMGRDAGISMVNCPSFPVQSTGSGLNDIYVTGDYRSATGKIYKVKISSTGGARDQIRISTNNGSSYGASQDLYAHAPYQLGSDNAYVYFEHSTGHTLNDVWTFNSHQVYKVVNYTRDVYANRNEAYSEDGLYVTSLYFNVPYGCHSRYKVYITFTATGYTPELSGKIFYGGYGTSYGGKLYSGGSKFDWIAPGVVTNWADIALIDLTASAVPGFMHPAASGEVKIDILTRSIGTISNPASLEIESVYLIPCPDENSWFHAGWTDDGDEYEHYCNYDMDNPYMVETIQQGVGSYRRVMPLNGTYGGNFLTLIPKLDNTIVMVPLFTTTTNWRETIFPEASYTGYTSVSYKPRYLVL